MQTRLILIDTLCHLATDKDNGAAELKNFLQSPYSRFADENEPLNLNHKGSKGLRPVEAAARFGSVSSLKYLIEELQVDISTDQNISNLAELALLNPNLAVRDYILDPEKKLWHRFKDDTTDFMAHVLAGRYKLVSTLLTDHPDKICDYNIRHQNVFSLLRSL